MQTQLALFTSVALAAAATAGEMSSTTAAKQAPMALSEPAPYEAGRGLITLEGPSGLFINPTSATLPQGAFTAQYCFLLPENDSNPWGHGYMLAYGVTDWAEIGLIGNYIDIDNADDPFATGPFARIRLTKDEGWMPQFSIGGYSRFGDDPLESHGIFAALYKRLPIDEDGFLKSLGFHAGVRNKWLDGPDQFNVYGGLEVQLPYRFYLVGEVSSKDSDTQSEVPYAFGIQWRAGGVNISVAGIQDGTFDEPAFYFGIGTQLTF